MKYWIALMLALTLNAVANLMMKFGTNRLADGSGPDGPGFGPLLGALAKNWVLILGLACFATNVIFYIFALRGIQISVAYPVMFCGGVAIIALVAWLFLGERLSGVQWLGLAFIVVGVLLVSYQSRPTVAA